MFFLLYAGTLTEAAFYKGFSDSEDRPFLGRIDPLSGHIRDGIIRDSLLEEVGQLVPVSMCLFSYMRGRVYRTLSFLLYAGSVTEAPKDKASRHLNDSASYRHRSRPQR